MKKAERQLLTPINSMRIEVARAAGFDLKRWAAYSLGWSSNSLGMWRQLLWEIQYDDLRTLDGVSLTLDELRYAKEILAESVVPAVFDETGKLIDRLAKINKDFGARWKRAKEHPRQRLACMPGEDEWNHLCSLVTLAITEDHPLRPWLSVGQSVGRWMHHDYVAQFRHQPQPALRPAMAAFLLLPVVERSQLPTSKRLADMLDSRAYRGENQFVGQFARTWPAHEPAITENATLWNCVWCFNEALATELLGWRDKKPRWSKECGELSYDGGIVRQFDVAKAVNAVALLDRFESAGWPHAVDDPGFDQEACYKNEHKQYTLATLNRGLKRIRFKGSGTDRGVCWIVSA